MTDMRDRTMIDTHADGIPAALFTFFESLPRQGPGSAAVTARLFERVRPLLPTAPAAADMGCGSGAAGLVLAAKGARVIGVDIHPPFLDAFRREAEDRGLGDRVETRLASMADSGMADMSLDLVWSEGAAYIVGFDAALAEFRRLLRPGGVAVISECTWLRDDPPEDLRAFWGGNYPGMRTTAANRAAAEAAGWRVLHTEVLAPDVWEKEFYAPMERLIASLEEGSDPDLKAIAEESAAEIALFRRYHDYYGYVFYLLHAP